MEYGLKHSMDLSKEERRERVEDMAELLGISDLLDNYPNQMSGGQKQRVALGRALVREPDVFLLDEPLSNLDAKLRAQMRSELQRIHGELGVTTLYVTHDQKEAMTMADRIAIMDDGKLQQFAEPEEAYYHPVNKFVATFLGSPAMNVFRTSVVSGSDEYRFEHDGKTIARIPTDGVDDIDVETVDLGLRPEDLILTREPDDGQFTGTVTVSEYQGNDNFVHLRYNDVEFTARVPPTILPDRHDTVGLSVEPEYVYLFDPETGEALKTRDTEERRTITRERSA
jgi:multiple sugar transport system ATP-binding protein